MKKITFILFALIAGTTFAQDNEASAAVNAEIVSPISIVATGPLEFGRIAADPLAPQTITVDLSNNRNSISGVTLSGGTLPAAATFDIVAASTTYTVTVTATDLLDVNDANPMALSLTPSLTGNQTGSQSLIVGGSIIVPAAHPAGDYTGSATVRVNYN